MARRKGWDNLSPKYRARLESGGIRRQDYEGNIPLDIARGHSETPEHGLKDAVLDPDRWHEYIGKNSSKLTPNQISILHDWLRGNRWPSWATPKDEWRFLFYR